jgi:hypothetical protein
MSTETKVVAAILGFLLALSVYGHYQTGSDLNRLCDLLGPHDVEMLHPQTTKDEIDNICLRHAPADDF